MCVFVCVFILFSILDQNSSMPSTPLSPMCYFSPINTIRAEMSQDAKNKSQQLKQDGAVRWDGEAVASA